MRDLALVFLLAALSLGLQPNTFAHEGRHKEKVEAPAPKKSEDLAKEIYAAINSEYEKTAKPIFRKSCMECHGSNSGLPWYHFVPGVTQMIDADISEAHEHLDMSEGFPFGGHGTPAEDLDAIEDSLKNGTMPPLRYRIMHWEAKLSENEKKIVQDWIDSSRKAMNQIP